MPLIIKLDVADDGRVYAWMKDNTTDRYKASSTYASSVPAVLRKLALKIARESK